MKGWLRNDNTFLSVKAYLIKFYPMNLDLGSTFIAYLPLLGLLSTKYTSPNEPLPIYIIILMLCGPTLSS